MHYILDLHYLTRQIPLELVSCPEQYNKTIPLSSHGNGSNPH